MSLSRFLTPSSRVLDVGATTPGVARALADGGLERYLALVPPGDLAAARARAGDLAHRFHPLSDLDQAVRNNADVVLLRQPFTGLLWQLRRMRHLSLLAVERGGPRDQGDLWLARVLGGVPRHVRPGGATTIGGVRLTLLTQQPVRPERPRRYLSEALGVTGLAAELSRGGRDPVVLRWFEELPRLEPGEDLDVLAADEDLAGVRDVLDREPGTIPVDLYSVSGLPGADYAGAAYYPPALARRILEGSLVHDSGMRVPNPRDHLHSLAYHAVYHKGLRSGLPTEGGLAPHDSPEHDYAGVLRDLAADVGVDLPATMEGIDGYLAGVGWRPGTDTLRRLSVTNPWVATRVTSPGVRETEPPEPAVFLLRERLLEVAGLEEVAQVLRRLNFEVLRLEKLDDRARERCSREARGGNWAQGPYPTSGGPPVAVAVAVHYGPRRPPPDVLRKYPLLTNGDVADAKRLVRELVDARVHPSERFNAVHSADNEPEAWEYVALAVPGAEDELRGEVQQRREAYRTPVPVRAVLSRGRRSKVEVVEHEGHAAVRKTYAPPFADHLERELAAMAALHGSVPAVPRPIATGDGWFVLPLYSRPLVGPAVRSSGHLLPLARVRQVVDVLRAVHAEGFDLVDAKPENFLLDDVRGLTLIDLEFAHRPTSPTDLRRTCMFAGPEAGFSGPLPVSDFSYEYRWRRLTGLPLDVLLDGSPFLQHVHRTGYRAQRLRRRVIGSARRRGGTAARQLLRALRLRHNRLRLHRGAPALGAADGSA